MPSRAIIPNGDSPASSGDEGAARFYSRAAVVDGSAAGRLTNEGSHFSMSPNSELPTENLRWDARLLSFACRPSLGQMWQCSVDGSWNARAGA